ncbi:hypothetical protein [Pseudonocardia sp. H11422]|uniref:hypothetical protein n=1 Tax=Pseudonocardia sp. H11422 TaxID=2835866 RepID=UPI001BDC59E2|nr:hypothetical protein [Pseudonocardia sp. H11422]
MRGPLWLALLTILGLLVALFMVLARPHITPPGPAAANGPGTSIATGHGVTTGAGPAGGGGAAGTGGGGASGAGGGTGPGTATDRGPGGGPPGADDGRGSAADPGGPTPVTTPVPPRGVNAGSGDVAETDQVGSRPWPVHLISGSAVVVVVAALIAALRLPGRPSR